MHFRPALLLAVCAALPAAAARAGTPAPEAVSESMPEHRLKEIAAMRVLVMTGGLVSGNDVDGDYRGFSKYYAWLTFDGKLSKVDIRMIAKSKPNELPTAVDSICMQDGYGGLPQMK